MLSVVHSRSTRKVGTVVETPFCVRMQEILLAVCGSFSRVNAADKSKGEAAGLETGFGVAKTLPSSADDLLDFSIIKIILEPYIAVYSLPSV